MGFTPRQKADSTGSTSSLREGYFRPCDSPAPYKVASNVMGWGAGGELSSRRLAEAAFKTSRSISLADFSSKINLSLKTASRSISFNRRVSLVYELVVKF